MSWSAPLGHVWTTSEVVTAANMNTYIRLNLLALNTRLDHSNSIATSETTTSTLYTDLATRGPRVLLVTGTRVLVILTCNIVNSGANFSNMSVAVSGATTTAAADANTFFLKGTNLLLASRLVLLTVTSGNNTFTAKYRVTGGTGTFSTRSIIVIPQL